MGATDSLTALFLAVFIDMLRPCIALISVYQGRGGLCMGANDQLGTWVSPNLIVASGASQSDMGPESHETNRQQQHAPGQQQETSRQRQHDTMTTGNSKKQAGSSGLSTGNSRQQAGSSSTITGYTGNCDEQAGSSSAPAGNSKKQAGSSSIPPGKSCLKSMTQAAGRARPQATA